MPRAVSSEGVELGASSPGSLIVTFAGLYLREIGGWIAVADLIKLMEVAGQAPTAVRQALVRLKSRDFLASERRGRQAGYRLTVHGFADLAVGDGRIFRFGEAEQSDGWVLAVFSVPEHARTERHRLRTQLTWLGFGTVSAGVWVAPAALADRARSHINGCGLGEYVTWFTGNTMESDVDSWWDLEALAGLYGGFLARWEPAAAHSNPVESNGPAMAGYLALVDDWRQFPRIDPGLPPALLPPEWPGRRAFELFSALKQRWSTQAERFVRAQLET